MMASKVISLEGYRTDILNSYHTLKRLPIVEIKNNFGVLLRLSKLLQQDECETFAHVLIHDQNRS